MNVRLPLLLGFFVVLFCFVLFLGLKFFELIGYQTGMFVCCIRTRMRPGETV